MTVGLAPHHAAAAEAGADCLRCPLHGCGAGPVPPELPRQGSAGFLVVSEYPSPAEVDDGVTLTGAAGREIRGMLSALGVRASYTNAILCRPSGGDIDAAERQWKKEGKPSAVECCRPRLQREVVRADYVLWMGQTAVRGGAVGKSAAKLRGTPLRTQPQGLVTLHPSFVLADAGRLMRSVFRADVQKAVRLSRGGDTWQEPPYHVVQTVDELRAFLAWVRQQPYIAVDTETDGIDPWTCNIRRIGIGTHEGVGIVAPLSVHGQRLLPLDVWQEMQRVLASFLAEPLPFGFHNFFGFDSILLTQHGLSVNETRLFDSLLGHAVGPTSEFPHKLDFLASIYTDAPRWKDDVKHSDTRDDATLDRYLSYDIATTSLCAGPVRTTVKASQQEPIYELNVNLSRIGRSMARIGVRIDNLKRQQFLDEYTGIAARKLTQFHEAAGRDINPRSVPQLKRLFYEDLGLPVLDDYRTDTGEPSTAEPVLLDLLSRGVDRRAETIIHALLGFREADKIISTYLNPYTHTDGRVRTTWKVHGTVTGRWSSGDPLNLQNVPKKLRAMFVPAPGNVFVAADYSALELRILALLSSDAPLIQAFAAFDVGTGPDIHVVNACTVFNTTPEKITDEPRTFAKRFVYGLSYGAGPPKIFQTMSLLRNDKLEPVFPGLKLSEIEATYKKWWAAHPSIVAWQKALIMGWRRDGFIATPWHGRRRYFVAGENHEEMKNFPIQGAAADLQNRAVMMLTSRYPFDYSRSRGLILQVHDQTVVECAEHEAEGVKRHIEESMQVEIGPMKFPAAAKIGTDWKSVS